jgi:hypothetical protein
LKILAVHNAHNAVARGLRLGGNNAQTLAHQSIHERAFAHVGVAYNIYKTGFMHKKIQVLNSKFQIVLSGTTTYKGTKYRSFFLFFFFSIFPCSIFAPWKNLLPVTESLCALPRRAII